MEYITSKQLSEWEAYDKIDPIGTWREDFRTAKITSLLLNIVNSLYCEKGTKPKIVSILDEMPDWTGDKKKEADKKQTMEEMKEFLLSWATQHNASVDKLKKAPTSKKKKV